MSAVTPQGSLGSSQGSPDEEDFGLIRPSLIRQLRSILDQYPDDGQILKELLQNAEDAKATVVRFLHDERQHSTDPSGLFHPGLAKHQGPALYAFNDALFDQKDWVGIRMLQESIKEKDPMKVGRFGLGFKSVLHMTDFPSVVSGDRVAFIDPHEKYFTFQGQATTGYSWNLAQHAAEIKNMPDQFAPYKGVFGCCEDSFRQGYLPGTLFRFPLRQETTDLSETRYDSSKIQHLFESFQSDAHLLLVFLKSVEAVELYIRKEDETQAQQMFRVNIAPECLLAVKSKRQRFLSSIDTKSWMESSVSVTYLLIIETATYSQGIPTCKDCHRYLVNEYYAGGEASVHLKSLHKDPILAHVPLVGVALMLRDQSQLLAEDPDNGNVVPGETESDDEPEGHVFCFLPLPVEERSSSGLPVHVNGYFSVSQNRRHLKWPTAGQSLKTDKGLLWNQCLLEELIPKSYVNLIQDAIEMSKSDANVVTPQHVLSAVPNIMEVNEKWHGLLDPFFTEIFQSPVFFTKAVDYRRPYGAQNREDGRWIPPSESVFDCMWDRLEMKQIVKKVLIEAGVNVVDVPKHFRRALGAYGKHSPETITPGLVRHAIRQHPDTYGRLSFTDRLTLLEFTLGDEGFMDLEGLQLIPLANNQFDVFTNRQGVPKVYIPSSAHPRELLPKLECNILAENLNETLQKQLDTLADEGASQLRHLDKDAVIGLLPQLIPKGWYQQEKVTYDPTSPPSQTYPPASWLQVLWTNLRRHFPGDLSMFAGLPILPIVDTSTDPAGTRGKNHVVCRWKSRDSWCHQDTT